MKNFKQNLFLPILLFSLSLSGQNESTIYLIGDSTMASKENPEVNPEHGWGQFLPELMSSGINFENCAVNGRSSKSFIEEGRWSAILDELKPGDFVFIQFGHNDQKLQEPALYTNPLTQYRYNLERYVRESREKGAVPVLLSSIVRRKFNKQHVLVDTHGNYPLVTRMVAADLEVPFIDLQWLSERLEYAYGPEGSKDLHLHFKPGENDYYPDGKEDDTHLSRKGAKLIASLALKEIDKQQIGLSEYIKPEVKSQKLLPD